MHISTISWRILALLVAAIFCSAATIAFAAEDEGYFPFLPSFDAPENITNVSAWLPRPAGGEGFVRASNGRLVVGRDGTTQTERPIRFWATNTCFSGNFPDRAQAERVAARLALGRKSQR